MNLILFLFFSTISLAAPNLCAIVSETPHARLERCKNLSIVYLSGQPKERSRAMGELLNGALSRDVLNYFSYKALDASGNKANWAKPAKALAYNQIVRLLHQNTPIEIAEEVDALAEGAHLDPIILRRALSLADIGSFLNALGNWFPSLPSAGCTSLAKSDGNEFVFGRNLDFAGVNTWDQHPAITVTLPPPGSSELKHLAIGADGMMFGGITGVNEAGIAFAVHQNYTKSLSWNGIPMVFIGELVLRSARTLEDALRILNQYRPGPLWTFLVADLNKKQIMAVESSTEHFEFRKMDDQSFVQTNHMLSSDKSMEFISSGTKFNSEYRMKFALDQLSDSPPNTNWVKRLAELLAHQESEGDLSAYHDIIKAHTIQTVIFESKQETNLYLSIDPAPTASGMFLKIPLKELWAGTLTSSKLESQNLTETAPEKRRKQVEISQAFHSYFDHHNRNEALQFLQDHKSLDASLFQAVALTQEKKFQQSLVVISQALENPRWISEPAYIMQSAQWVKIVNLWQLGRTEEARNLTQKLYESGPANPRIKNFAKALLQGHLENRMLQVGFEFFSGDLSGRSN